MVGGFTLSQSLGDKTPKLSGVSSKAHLAPEKQPPMCDEKGWFSRNKPIRSANMDDRTRGIKESEGKVEISVSRKGRRLVATEEKTPV